MTGRYRKNLPSLWLMTDERMSDAALLCAVMRLPRGRAGLVFRHYATPMPQRRALFKQVQAIARRRRVLLILAGDARMATAWRADGWHGRDDRIATRPLIHSRPAHDAREIGGRADLLFLSPLYPTRSHPGAPSLGRVRFAALARKAAAPVIALGGMRHDHHNQLKILGAHGWAAIDGLTPKDPVQI